MKKICSFLILFLLLTFSIGCLNKKEETFFTKGFNITSVSINNELEGIDIKFQYLDDLDIDELNQELDEKKISVGLLIKYQEILNIDELTIEDNQYLIEIDSNSDNNYRYIFKEDLKENLNKYISIRLFYSYKDNGIKYRYSDQIYSNSLYDLAISDEQQPVVETYTITYILNGGTNSSDAPTQYQEGEGVMLPVPTKEGYKFLGWSKVSGSTEYVTEITATETGNVTLYANWEEEKEPEVIEIYTITYQLNGGRNASDAPIEYKEGEGVILPTPTKEGYKFLGWSKELGSTSYVTEIAATEAGNVTLYANWEKEQNQPIVEKYTITYVLNGGTNASDAPTRYQEGIGAKLPTPTKSGYKFLGWSKVSGSTEYVTEIAATETGNITLYANWEAITYTITYVLNGGTNPSNAPTQYEKGKGVTLPTPIRSGYKFLGWSKELDSTTYIIKISTADDGNITLYANWKKNSLSGNIIDAFRKEISLISCQLDYKNYLIRSLESNYQAEILKPLDYEIINVLITIKDGARLKEDFELKINGIIINEEDYVVDGKKIFLTLKDNKVRELNVLIDYSNKNVYIENEFFDLNFDVEDMKYHIILELNENYLFNFDFKLMLNGEELSHLQYNLDGQIIIFDYVDNVVREISIVLDTLNYIVSTDSNKCSVIIQKPLDYIYINTIITLADGLVFSENFKLIVNNVEIEEENYLIDRQKNILTYIIDDPNWTKPY